MSAKYSVYSAYRDSSTGHTYIPVTEYLEEDVYLCRCSHDGYYYHLSGDELDAMIKVTANNNDVTAALEDREQGRLGFLVRERTIQ